MSKLIHLAICYYLFLAPFLLKNIATVHHPKPKTLSMLALVPLLDEEIQGGIGCMLAMQVAVNNVNNRSDILPDYHLDIVYRDEGEDAPNNLGDAIKYFFEFVGNETAPNTTKSPIVVGTLSSNGCPFIGAFAHLYNMVEIAIACVFPSFTANRQLLPNLYRPSISDEFSMFPIVRFIQDVGKWSRIAIYATSVNDYDYTMAEYAYQVFVQEGIQVVWFNEYPAVDDNFASLVSANTRIIVTFIAPPNIIFLTFCQWHYARITPDTGYVFILRTHQDYDENGILNAFKNICPRDILLSQFRSVFFIGSIEYGLGNNEVSTLGYNINEFDSQWSALVRQYTPLPSRIQHGYSIRTRCHESMLQAIMTLDLAERKLNTRNLTLEDYTLQPELVGDIVNQSAAKVNYTGVRGSGPKVYSERLEFENEVQQVRQFFPGTGGLGTLLYTVHKTKPWPINGSSYVLKKFREPTWVFSPNPGQPPNDSWNTRFSLVTVPEALRYFVIALASTLISVHVVVAVRILWLIAKDSPKYQQWNRVLILVGCLTSSIAAIFFVLEGLSVCLLRYSLTIIGTSLIHGSIFFKLLILYHTPHELKIEGFKMRLAALTRSMKSPSHTSPATSQVGGRSGGHNTPVGGHDHHKTRAHHAAIDPEKIFLPAIVKSRDQNVAFLATLFLALNGLILLAWFVRSQPALKFTSYSKEPRYEIATDTFVYEQVHSCISPGDSYTSWIAAFTALHGFILLISLFLAFELRRLKILNSDLATDLIQTRVVSVNSAVMLAAVVLILFVFKSPLIQHEIVAIALLIYVIILTIVVFLTGSNLMKSSSPQLGRAHSSVNMMAISAIHSPHNPSPLVASKHIEQARRTPCALNIIEY